jgi:hypothetical protein
MIQAMGDLVWAGKFIVSRMEQICSAARGFALPGSHFSSSDLAASGLQPLHWPLFLAQASSRARTTAVTSSLGLGRSAVRRASTTTSLISADVAGSGFADRGVRVWADIAVSGLGKRGSVFLARVSVGRRSPKVGLRRSVDVASGKLYWLVL